MVDHGGLFDSWEPYANLPTMTYHFGFHVATAVFHWITGLSSPKAVLWVGQIFNGMAIIALYPLAVNLGRNKWAGNVAVLLVGLLFSMPMTYVNWGRYTQLAGLIILPAAVFLLLEMTQEKQINWGVLALGWILVSGLALTHYRLLFYFLILLPVVILFEIRNGKFRITLTKMIWLGVGSLFLFFPWLFHIYSGRLGEIFNEFLTTSPQSVSTAVQQTNIIGSISFYVPIWAWISLIVVVVLGLWLRKKPVAVISLWWFFIFLATNPAWFRLPGTGVLTNFALFISIYVLAGWLLGAAVGWIVEHADQRFNPSIKTALRIIGIVVFICLAFIGARQRLGDVNIPGSALVTRPDIRAAAWIREDTPVDAIFLVNSFFAYNDTLVVGSDGGWWLPILAGRRTPLPPITYSFEGGAGSANMNETNYLTREIQDKGITNPDIITLLVERGIRYIYIGQRQGRVNYSGPYILDPNSINDDPNFKNIYHQDRVWIFEVVP
jgi:hypothetical protein